MTRSLARLLRPKSIAVIGGREAAMVVEQCQAFNFEGTIWPVHPSKSQIHSLPVFRSISELPSAPDAAFVAVNRDSTIEIIDALRQSGAGGAICYASGYSEADQHGNHLQRALIDAAGSMPVIGPNCYGLLNYVSGVALWPDQHGGKQLDAGKTGVAIVTQSSNIAINITMQKRGLPIAYILTAGNQAQTGLSELAINLLNDPQVTALGLHIEGFDSIRGLEELSHAARALNKPVIAMKIGRSPKARQAAFTHTASLAGSDAAGDEFLKRISFARLNSISSFLETLKLLHVHGPLGGNRISSMSCSGGEASLVADAAHGRKIRFPSLSENEKKPISEALGPMVAIDNPLDYQTYVWGNYPGMLATFTGMLNTGMDLNCLILDYPRSDRCSANDWEIPTTALSQAGNITGAKTAVISTLHENLDEQRATSLIDGAIAPLLGLDESLDAIEAAAAIGEGWRQPAPQPLFLQDTKLPIGEFVPNEDRAKAILNDYGIDIPYGLKADNTDDIVKNAEIVGFPVVAKALGFAHKSEIDAVRLNLSSTDQVRHAATDLLAIADEIYVEEFVSDGILELLVGLTRDEPFGLILTIATGGTLVEVLADTQTILLPANSTMIRRALRNLKSCIFFDGFRGQPKADLEATIEAIMAVQDFALQNSSSLIELDINPLIIRPATCRKEGRDAIAGQIRTRGAIATDALIKFAGSIPR